MAIEEVTSYQVQYIPEKQIVRFLVETKSGWYKKPVSELPVEKAAFLIDMLRNEKPIYYYTDNSAIQTVREKIGEGEQKK
jgi:hypothetical protein